MEQNIFNAIEFVAVVTSAIYGILQARATRLDPLGVFTLAFAVAFGGGTLRDLFLDRAPLFWIANGHYPLIVFGMAMSSCLVRKIPQSVTRYLHVPDALGLGLFGIVGTQYALEAGTTHFVAVLMGVITGTFGGVISDIICNRVPSLFQSSPLYATCAFIGCYAFLAANASGLGSTAAAAVGIGVTVCLRFASLYWRVCLPELE